MGGAYDGCRTTWALGLEHPWSSTLEKYNCDSTFAYAYVHYLHACGAQTVLYVVTVRCKCVIVRLAESNCLLMEYIQSHRGCLQSRPLATDYLPALRAIAKAEDIRKATSRKRRSGAQSVFVT